MIASPSSQTPKPEICSSSRPFLLPPLPTDNPQPHPIQSSRLHQLTNPLSLLCSPAPPRSRPPSPLPLNHFLTVFPSLVSLLSSISPPGPQGDLSQMQIWPCQSPAQRFATAFRKHLATPPASLLSLGFCHYDTHVPSLASRTFHMLFLPPRMPSTSFPTRLTPCSARSRSPLVSSRRLSLISHSHPSWVRCPHFWAPMANPTLIFVSLGGPRAP